MRIGLEPYKPTIPDSIVTLKLDEFGDVLVLINSEKIIKISDKDKCLYLFEFKGNGGWIIRQSYQNELESGSTNYRMVSNS